MRLPKRLRLAFDHRLTAASVLDVACELQPDRPILRPERPLPYPGLTAAAITPTAAWGFVARSGEFLREAGMEIGDRVAIFKRNEIDYPLLSLAIMRAGGIAVPINGRMSQGALLRHLRVAEAKFVCGDCDSYVSTFGDRQPSVARWIFTDRAPDAARPAALVISEAIVELPGNEPPVVRPSDSPVMLAHTSGTTGTPKLVVCNSDSFAAGIRAHFRTEPPLPWTRVGIAGPFSHLVYQMGVSTLLLSRMNAWGLDDGDPEAALATIDREKLNLFVAFPHLYLRMYAAGFAAHNLRSMRVWIAVADASHEAHMSAFCKQGGRLGSLFVEPLGSSEIGGPALRRFWTRASRPRCRRRIGRPMLGGPRVKVVDETGNRVAAGKSGRLVVKGPTVFSGYWGQGSRSEAAPGGWWATGDTVARDRWGRYRHLDRESDIVHTQAGPFYTLPAEDVLHMAPGVNEVVIFGVPAANGYEQPVALVWVDAKTGLTEDELRQWANARLGMKLGLTALTVVSPGMVPRGLTGKVLKAELRKAWSEGLAGSGREVLRAR